MNGHAVSSRSTVGFGRTTKIDVLNNAIDNIDLEETFDIILDLSHSAAFRYVVTPNAQHYVLNVENQQINEVYNNAALCVNDSKFVQHFLRLFDCTITTVAGSDLTRKLAEHLHEQGAAVTLVGLAEADFQKLQAKYPRIKFAHHNPSYGFIADPDEIEQILSWIEAQNNAFCFFAVGTPQGETLAHRLTQRGRAQGVGLCTGAAFEFLIGVQRRAPLWVQRAGFEWLFRLARDPKRLWRRYLVLSPRFLYYYLFWRHRLAHH